MTPRKGMRTILLKVGGSLLVAPGFPSRLRAFLDCFRDERFVIVVGGGKCADFIRELDSAHGIGEKRSHALALQVLDVTAHVVSALVPGLEVVERPAELSGVWDRGAVPVLAPRRLAQGLGPRSVDALPERWDVTTDSIAAQAAAVLGVDELWLLKSTGTSGISGRVEAANAGLVDPYFPIASAPFARVLVINLRADPPTEEWLD